MKKEISIYVHIPYCMSKCSYCSFISWCKTNEHIDSYFNCLKTEIVGMSKCFKNKIVKTIYFGGGTPSLVNEKYIKEVLDIIKQNYSIYKKPEITIECNPGTCTREKLITYYNVGINRVSFGVQCLNNNCLTLIGRKHNKKMAIESIKLAKSVGFKNISCDLLIGIPNQTFEMIKKDVTTLANLGVNHISAYMLMLEEGTKLYEQVVINKNLKVPCDDDCVYMYNLTYSLLKKFGFKRYEISNFAKDGFECKHNVNYWNMGEYVGFGVAAHSFYNNQRIAGLESFEDYQEYVKNKFCNIRCVSTTKPSPEIEKIDDVKKIEECLMLGLRQEKGVNLKLLKSYGYDVVKNKIDVINLLKEHKLIDYNLEYLYITPQNFGAANQIILSLLPN